MGKKSKPARGGAVVSPPRKALPPLPPGAAAQAPVAVQDRPAVAEPAPASRWVAEGAAGTVRTAPGYVPAGSRGGSRQAKRQARKIAAGLARREEQQRRAAAAAERKVRAAHPYLPPGGEPGEAQLRMFRRLRLQQHRGTSNIVAGAYPFLAEAGLGERGVYVGTDSWSGAAFCFDPWQLYADGVVTNPNVALAGVIGSGKSTCAKSLAVRSVAFGRRVYVPGDPKGEWSPVARAVGGQVIELGGGMNTRLNPLDEGPRPEAITDAAWANMVRSRRLDLLRAMVELALRRPLGAVESTALYTALDDVVRGNDDPLLPQVVRAMFEPAEGTAGSTVEQLREDGRDVAHALNRLVGGDLAGLFDGPSTTRFDTVLPMVSLDLSRIQGSDELIALVMTCASAWMESAIVDASGGQRWIVYDEAWRLFQSPALLARMQSQWKLSRAWGIANLMVIHRLSDLVSVGEADSSARNLALGLLADCSTKIIYAQEEGENEKTGAAIGLTGAEIAQLPDLRRGEGLWKVKNRAFMVMNTITESERELFDTNARMTG